jgi:hypothetical protein
VDECKPLPRWRATRLPTVLLPHPQTPITTHTRTGSRAPPIVRRLDGLGGYAAAARVGALLGIDRATTSNGAEVNTRKCLLEWLPTSDACAAAGRKGCGKGGVAATTKTHAE